MDQQQLLDAIAGPSADPPVVAFERRSGMTITVTHGKVRIETPDWMDAEDVRWLIHTAGPAALDALER